MNKEVIDCIQADIDRKNKEKQEKEELIAKIYDFFKDLPEGTFVIKTTMIVYYRVLKNNPMFSKEWFKDSTYFDSEQKEKLKEPWLGELGDVHSIEIKKINDKVFVRRNRYHDYMLHSEHKEISNWPQNAIQLFYEHLDWFENELKEQYCKGKA